MANPKPCCGRPPLITTVKNSMGRPIHYVTCPVCKRCELSADKEFAIHKFNKGEEGTGKMEKTPIELMTVKQVRELSCNYPGCRASKEQTGYEVLSDEKRIVSVFCPTGHKRSVQIRQDGMIKRRDSIKVGVCETKRCNRHWISTAGNRRFCKCCQDDRDKNSMSAAFRKYSERRRKAKESGKPVKIEA